MEEIKNLYGYGRISAKDQNEARQVQAFLEYGIKDYITKPIDINNFVKVVKEKLG